MHNQLHGLDCQCGLMDSLGVANNTTKPITQQYFYKHLKHTNGETYHEVETPNGVLISHIKHSSSRGCFESYTHLTCKRCFKGDLKLTSTSSGW
jgi:hypothetical protein